MGLGLISLSNGDCLFSNCTVLLTGSEAMPLVSFQLLGNRRGVGLIPVGKSMLHLNRPDPRELDWPNRAVLLKECNYVNLSQFLNGDCKYWEEAQDPWSAEKRHLQLNLNRLTRFGVLLLRSKEDWELKQEDLRVQCHRKKANPTHREPDFGPIGTSARGNQCCQTNKRDSFKSKGKIVSYLSLSWAESWYGNLGSDTFPNLSISCVGQLGAQNHPWTICSRI